MTYLQIKDLKKSYKNKVILKNINFSAKKGEFVTLLGPSGCGKSTLLRCIAGLSKIDSGKIEIDNKDITKLPPKKRNIGMVFQNYALFPNMDVYENVSYGLKIKKLPKDDIKKQVKKIIEIVGLEDKVKAYPHNLSGGQMQRVALARSLVTKPNILLLDEPLSALDAKIRKHLREQIKDITKSLNLTTIFVTHDQEEALVMSDKIILMQDGNIIQNSNSENLYLSPQNKFVANFIGNYNVLTPEALSNLITHDFVKNIAIRPETISITEKSPMLNGHIVNRNLLGNIIRYDIVSNGVTLKVDVLNYSRESFLDIGCEVGLSFDTKLMHELEDGI